MALINDRDILLLEPSVFVGAEAAATLLRNVLDGVVSGSTITSASSNFVTLNIDFGHVASITDVPCEVIARPSATQLTVSLPRGATTDPLIDPAPGTGQRLKIPTFKRLIDVSEAWALGALGIDATDPIQPLEPSAIVNLDALKRLIGLRVVHQAFAISAAINPASETLKDRAALYAALLDQAKRNLEVRLDLDGDGVADTVRRLDLVTYVRN
jgi:hypothetical protein